jgi:hypothetical protein
VEEEVPAVAVEQADDPRQGLLLARAQRRRLRLAGQGVPLRRRRTLAARLALQRGDELERAGRRGAVVVGEPQREIDERLRQLVDDVADRRRLHALRWTLFESDDDAPPARTVEVQRDDGALAHRGRDLVRERPGDRPGGDERVDGRVRHGGQRTGALL